MKCVGSKDCHSFASLWWRRTLGGAAIPDVCNLVRQELILFAFVGNVEHNVGWLLRNAHASSISE
jgi:hypothetical protein